MIEYLWGVFVGSLITTFIFWAYVSFKLYQFGWSWKMITGKVSEDKIRNYYQKKYGSYEIDPVNFKGDNNDRDKRTE